MQKAVEQGERSRELETLKSKIADKSLSLVDHLTYLRSPAILQNSKSLIILLNSFFKKLVANEGIQQDDDILRAVNQNTLVKVRNQLQEQQEVQHAIKILRAKRPNFDNNKLVGYLTYMQKTDGIDKKQMVDIFSQFKTNLMCHPATKQRQGSEWVKEF